MINFKKLRQYTHVVDGIRFLVSHVKRPFIIAYFSENSDLLTDYSKLNIRKIDVRYNMIPVTKIPRTRPKISTIKAFRKIGLISYPSFMKVPSSKSLFYDLSFYLQALDTTYKPSHYRQRLSVFIKNIINMPFLQFPNYEKVLLYCIDLTKPLNVFVNRKSFPILDQLKQNEFLFDYLILCVLTPKGPKYRLLVKDRSFSLNRLVTYLRMLRSKNYNIETEEDITGSEVDEKETNDATEEVMKNISDKILDKNKEKVQDAVKNYLSKDDITREKITSKDVKKEYVPKVAIASILYKVNGDMKKSVRITNSIPLKKSNEILKKVDKRYSDQILQKEIPINTSEDIIVKHSNTPKIVLNKAPNHLFKKRLIDFETNLEKDLTNSIKVLETKDIPLKMEKIEIVDKKEKPGEVEKSDIVVVKSTVKDSFGKKHNIKVEIPKIDPKSGTFRINGQRKCLINQIVLCPITFPKKYEGRFESSYSVFRIRSKKTRNLEYLEIFIGNTWLPLSIFLFYSFGFERTLNQYGIRYTISKTRPKRTEEFATKIDDENYIYFLDVNNQLKKEFCKSFIVTKVSSYNVKKEFGTKEYFNDLIIAITKRISSTFLISSNLENIVDPVAKQVLINQQLPSLLDQIIFYMSSKVVQGFEQDRNDITNQRIRGSEVLVHLIQKQLLASHTVYKEQVLSGNKNAKFELNETKVLSDFIRSEIVANMEYANPIEEMAVMTRISPVGKGIGGIPDKRAIHDEARNVHESYFGNIDPLDTPEGPMIGISQQLTIDSSITSARGLFSKKEFSDNEKSGILSTSSSMIPFIENNDGARIIMATNQAKQMLPLKNPEPPAVRSGYESLLTNVLSDNFVKKSSCDGKVVKIDIDSILIQCLKTRKIDKIDLTPVHLKSGSGKDTLGVFNVIVKQNQNVKQNQIVAEGSCISGGNISLGRTLCTAYMPYKGYNFEDGIVINERLISKDKLTSIHGIISEVLVSENDRILEIAKIGSVIEKGKPILRKTIGEIEQFLGFDEEEGEEQIGQQFIKKSPGGIVVDIDIYSNIDVNKFPLVKDLVLRTRKKVNAPIKEKFTIKGNLINGMLIRFKIQQELRINLGDKLCNRYGAKGIISLVEKDENMPKTPWGDSVDIIVNPIGVIGRSNIGQLYELYTGLISRDIGLRMTKLKTKSQVLYLIKKVYSILDNTKNKEFTTKLVANLSKLNDKEFSILINQIKTTGFSPIIIPPFQAPKQNQILEALKILDLKAGYSLYLPEYGVKTKSEVPVGYMYFSKLEHLADVKMYGRSTGPLVSKTLQPTAGKKLEGAQRLGEADTYALISYNCPTLLSEFMGPLSDDITTKNEIVSEIIQTGNASYKDSKMSPAKDLLNSYFISLILEKR